ncbi:MAG: DUF4373 domain-containing protein [Clostridiales bacterium]|nr:DUF4373 domain-containing protein [Clostridiales bacterium]
MADLTFFRHHSNERDQAKPIIIRYGAKGYGMYWYILESLYFSFNRDFEAGKSFYDRASLEMGVSRRIVRKVLEDMERFGVVTRTGSIISSGRVEREVAEMLDARKRRQQRSVR